MTGSISLDWELGVHTDGSIVSVWKIENPSSLRHRNPICLDWELGVHCTMYIQRDPSSPSGILKILQVSVSQTQSVCISHLAIGGQSPVCLCYGSKIFYLHSQLMWHMSRWYLSAFVMDWTFSIYPTLSLHSQLMWHTCQDDIPIIFPARAKILT